MKKIITLVLALVMIMSMSVTAFAAESEATNDGKSNTSITVTGKYVASEPEAVISVDISWGAMEFTYSEGSKGTWSPTNHQYENATEAGWNVTGNTITLTNHSNVPVNATFSFTKADENDTDNNVSIEFGTGEPFSPISNNTVRLFAHPNADTSNTGLDHVKTVDVKVSEGSTLGAGWTDGNPIGTITISLAQAN